MKNKDNEFYDLVDLYIYLYNCREYAAVKMAKEEMNYKPKYAREQE